MNFLDSVWLIPLFPLFGALAMLLVGRKLDPQGRHHSAKSKVVVSILCPGTVLVSFLFSLGAVWQLVDRPERTHQIIQFTGSPDCRSTPRPARWLASPPISAFCSIRSARS